MDDGLKNETLSFIAAMRRLLDRFEKTVSVKLEEKERFNHPIVPKIEGDPNVFQFGGANGNDDDEYEDASSDEIESDSVDDDDDYQQVQERVNDKTLIEALILARVEQGNAIIGVSREAIIESVIDIVAVPEYRIGNMLRDLDMNRRYLKAVQLKPKTYTITAKGRDALERSRA